MKAMVLTKTFALKEKANPLELLDLPVPEPGQNEILVKISACGVCHTELDEIEGRTPPSVFPVVPGHQVVGRVVKKGPFAGRFKTGDRVGVGWIYSSCGTCSCCNNGNENLCESFRATGRDANGGYAEYMIVPEGFAYSIPEIFSDTEAAPLLCAGSIGYRSIKLTSLRDGQSLGLTGFGASGHLVLKMVKYNFPEVKVFVFARSQKEREFALELGAVWTGDTTDEPPQKLDCIIDTTPAWKPVLEALKNLQSGGRLVINAIRKEDADKEYLLKINYQQHLWLEKEIKSVANVTRKDISEFLLLASEIPIKPEVQEYRLEEANTALQELKAGKIRGAKVLVMQ
ncbi:MAG: zinc-binding alcohol dehydrogenase family protein [Desulfobacteraceae bacterium]|jgi:propanol-preferring alcohol dehydrogenase|nr:MAG: zinc-binding alcohol dehydrogenase family protein [Desulfobacteraceae bacterium]